MMNSKRLTGLVASATVAATLAMSSTATAQVTETKYDAQYKDAPSDLLRLDYATWASFNALINNEQKGLAVGDLPELDLSLLRWAGGVQEVEVYFINEGAGYRNQLFYSVDGGETKDMIFGDVSSKLSILPNSDGPLRLGEGVSLGNFAGDTFLEFFVKSNGYNGGQHFLGFDPDKNPGKSQGLQHVLGYGIGDFVILAFEDILGGGDKDYNDVVFAVRGVTVAAPSPEPVPEPAAIVGLLGAGVMLVLRRR